MNTIKYYYRGDVKFYYHLPGSELALVHATRRLRRNTIVLPVLTILLSLPVGTTLPAGTVYSTNNPTPIPVTDSDSSDTFLSHSDNSLPEFESFSDHTEETRSGSTTTHANYSLLEYELFHFDNFSFPRPPLEPPDVENLEPEFNNFDVLNNNEPFDPREGENIVFLNVEEDDSFIFTIRTFLSFVTYPEVSPLSCSTRSEDTIFDPGIST
ncbi:hypothetical protein Tco_1307578 [Tanacetum coccineum]